MYALLVEYRCGLAEPPHLPLRWHYRALLARQPGYRRRLELQADGFQRSVDLFLFASREAAEAALADDERRQFAAINPCCADTTPALLVREGNSLGTPAVVLRRSAATSRNCGQLCWRDYLFHATIPAELW